MNNTPTMYSYQTFCLVHNLKKIRTFLKKSLSQINISDKEQNLIILAVDEICTNSIVHGNLQNEKSHLDISIKYLHDKVIIDISDRGQEFDYASYEAPHVQDLVKSGSTGSMGLLLVKKIMDSIEYNRSEEVNICRLTKKISVA